MREHADRQETIAVLHRIDIMQMLNAFVAHAPRRAASTLVSMPGQRFHLDAACITLTDTCC